MFMKQTAWYGCFNYSFHNFFFFFFFFHFIISDFRPVFTSCTRFHPVTVELRGFDRPHGPHILKHLFSGPS